MSWKFKRTINRIREKPFRALKIVRSLQPLIQIVVRVLPKSPFDERRAPSFMFKDGHHIECQRIVRSIGRACISVFAHTHTKYQWITHGLTGSACNGLSWIEITANFTFSCNFFYFIILIFFGVPFPIDGRITRISFY